MRGEEEIAAAVAQAKADAEAKADRAAQTSNAPKRRKRNFPFKVTDEGPDGEKKKRWLAFGSELHVLALSRSSDSEDWGRQLAVIDRAGVRHLWAMPQALHAGSGDQIFAELMRLGWEPEPGLGRKWRDHLRDYLMGADPERMVRCVSRPGWCGESFVLPDEQIGAADGSDEVILQAADRLDHALNVSGTLESWRSEIARPAQGNSRLVLAISAAFAAPLLALTGDDGGGFHFRGASSSGKSTALAVAGSVWGGGGPRGYVQSWRATDNGLEALAALHNDACLCLDELSQVESKAAGQAAYMLGNGVGKARAGREGQARKAHEWRLIFLSNGEVGLADKISEGGGKIAAGMAVRVIDLRADGGASLGIFEEIHGAANAAAFAQSLKTAASHFYGTAARAFLRAVVGDLPLMRDTIAGARKHFLGVCLPDGSDGQVRRVADRFALVAAAGELASALGITGWKKGTAGEACLRCFRDWLQDRGGIGASEVADAKIRIRREIEVNGHSRFLPWFHDPRTVIRTNTIGYVRRPDGDRPDEPTAFYFHTTGMAELLSGLERKSVLEGLAQEGVIVLHEVTRKGEQTFDLNKPFKVPSEKRLVRLYQVNLAALTGDPDSGDE
jgi:putative DNA primase/helicase